MMGVNAGSTANGTNAFSATCISPGGPERAFTFVAPANGTLYLTLDTQAHLGLYVDLGCGTNAQELQCVQPASTGAFTNLQLIVPKNTPLTVFVDSDTFGAAGDFTLLANFGP
jgi:hypothetical protein